MSQLTRTVLKVTTCCSLTLAAATHSFAFKGVEVSILKSNKSFRSNFNSQPNLNRGEVTMPVQVSIIYILEQSLPDFLTQLASRNKVKLTVSEKVSGVLKRISLPMRLELILPELSKAYGLEWHMQGKHLFVSSSLENTNRLIKLGDMNLVQLKEAVNKAGLNPGANRMSFIEKNNAVTLIGSSAYISKIELLVREFQTAEKSN